MGSRKKMGKKMRKKIGACILAAVWLLLAGGASLCGSSAAETPAPGTGFGFELSTGTQGAFSIMQAGILFPRIRGKLFVDVKVRYMSALTWATFIHKDTLEQVSFHPVVAAGVFSFGGYSPMIYGCVRMYGGSDLLLGYSFTPYDSLIYGTGNLIGQNLTFAVLGHFGLEFLTSERSSVFLDVGGGYKSLFGDDTNLYVIASGWLGCGFGFKMGVRLYL